MKLHKRFFRRSTAMLAGLALLGRLGMGGLPAQARDAAPAAAVTTNLAATTNSLTDTNNEEAEKAWRLVNRATQAPMPPPEWSVKPPTRDEQEKFYLGTLHSGMDLARDFYTHYPSHPKAATAQKIEYQLVSIAVGQFHDTNLAPRLATLEAKRMSDPNVSEDDKFAMRVHPLQDLMRGLPDTADELDRQVHALQKDFPKRPEVYKIMLMVLSHSEGARSEAWANEILASAAPDDIKLDARLTIRAAGLEKLIAGLPATADELDKSVRALPKEFPGQKEAYDLMLSVLQQMDAPHAAALAKDINASDAPDSVKERLKVIQRALDVEKLIAGFPGTMDEFMKGVHAFEKDYPQNPTPYNLMWFAFQKSEGAQTRALGAELLASPIQDALKNEVHATLDQMEFLGKPLDIQYTAVDGRKVDVTQMKGKVVLVDFWGTWCGTCMAELPKVKATYTKLHDKGFEIVGIDCNDPKDTLLKTVKSKDIPWPQYWESDEAQNKFASQYGVHIFPAMWLVDKKGILRHVNALDGLEDKVTKLLAE